MNQVLSKEEMAALLEGSLEAEADLDSQVINSPPVTTSQSRVFPGRRQRSSFHIFSTWLSAVRELRWPLL
jgi:hypothetical protein